MSTPQLLEFPGLGLSFNLDRVAFTLFGRFPIYWYGILFGLAFVVAALYIIRRVKTFGLDPDRMIDVLLGTVVGGLVGARLYYVIFSWDSFKDDLTQIFNVRQGGIAIYGGIIGAVLVALLMCRLRQVAFKPLADLFLTALLLAQAIGRWGNFVNIEAFGGNTTAPWGMTSPVITNYLTYYQNSLAAAGMAVDPSLPVHPTFFYESVWCLLGFVLLALHTKKRRYDGELTLLYMGWYGLGRFFIEGLRTDSLMWGSVRVSQVLAAACVVVSLAAMILLRRKIKAANDPAFMQLYVDTEEGQAILAGTFYPKKADKKAEDETGKEESPRTEDGDKPAGEGEEADASDREETPGEEADPDRTEDETSAQPPQSGAEEGNDSQADKPPADAPEAPLEEDEAPKAGDE